MPNTFPQLGLSKYAPQAAALLDRAGGGAQWSPLAVDRRGSPSSSPELFSVTVLRDELKRPSAKSLFSGTAHPEAALSGMHVYFAAYFGYQEPAGVNAAILEDAHKIAQDLPSCEGSYWHAIIHRLEPDPGNAAYWFRRVGRHPIFPNLREEAAEILAKSSHSESQPVAFPLSTEWDPFAFIDYCQSSRTRPASSEDLTARKIQLAEWQLLFSYCITGRVDNLFTYGPGEAPSEAPAESPIATSESWGVASTGKLPS